MKKFGRWRRKVKSSSVESISKKTKKKLAWIRFPWQKTEKQILEERKIKNMAEKEIAGKVKRMRVKFPERQQPTLIGPGYPSIGLVYANMEVARGERERKVLKRTREGKPVLFEPLKTELPHPVPDPVFAEFCSRVGIENYNFYEADTEPRNAIDLTAFDLYWEDIRIEREIIVKELKHLPLVAPIELQHLPVLEKAIFNISRSCYYSPAYSHKKSEDVIHLMVWFLNRRNLPIAFQIKVLQAVSLITYQSSIFKNELVRCGGIKVLYRLTQVGQIICGLLASWACYALTIACIGSPEVIFELQQIPDLDEIVGEMTFGMYWYYFPCNFANILQACVFGPGGVANSLEIFEFL